MTNAKVLRNRRKAKLNAKKRARKRIMDFILTALIFVFYIIFINGFFSAWDKEIEAHGEYNRNYIKQIEMNRNF